MNTRTRISALIAIVFVGAAVLPMAPLASAHTCADHYTCPSDGCIEGENHDHTDYNSEPVEDGRCKSSAAPPEDPNSCDYYGLHHPPTVCKLLGEGNCLANTLLSGSQRSTRVTCVS